MQEDLFIIGKVLTFILEDIKVMVFYTLFYC